MRPIFLFDLRRYARSPWTYLAIAGLILTGVFTGSQFNMDTGTGIYLNSPYQVGFMLGMLSLSVIFMATILGAQLLFKERDTRFDAILFSCPVSKQEFVTARLLALLCLTLAGLLCISLGFAAGLQIRTGAMIQAGFHPLHYLYPFLVFGCGNSLFVCSLLCWIAWRSEQKLLMTMSGLMLYVLYMVAMLFSNSPFMAHGLPQSITAQRISAFTDPFGLSAYFYNSAAFSVADRNALLVPLSGYFLANRLLILALSLGFIRSAYLGFSLSSRRTDRKKRRGITEPIGRLPAPLLFITPVFSFRHKLQALWSYCRVDLNYLFRGIPFYAGAVILLFTCGMELYAAIEKGIRVPQQYARSGLMAVTISENFHLAGLLLMVYFVNDLSWKSRSSRFSPIEATTVLSVLKQTGHALSYCCLLLCYTLMLILLGIVFQLCYQYPYIDWEAYAGVLIFCTLPLWLLSLLLSLINQVAPRSYIALGISVIIALATASPLSRKCIPHPLFRFLSGYFGPYSDFSGYGPYLPALGLRLLFGGCLVGILSLTARQLLNRRFNTPALTAMVLLAITGFYAGNQFMAGYEPGNETAQLQAAARYERSYRRYQDLPQPLITAVQTQIDLFPGRSVYTIRGHYTLKNLSDKDIPKVLVNFSDELRMHQALYITGFDTVQIKQPVDLLRLPRPLQPGDSAQLLFTLSYTWSPANGHQPFNAITGNGSFMRISRYYPQIGYNTQREISDTRQREIFALGPATPLRKLEAPRSSVQDFVTLDMVVSTDAPQTAIGTGTLIRQWTKGNRSYFHYQPETPVPFRFAVSSAQYQQRRVVHKGITITVYYHPLHAENVDRLIYSARQTLDYCREHFGPYPFTSISFAEISAFTRGFAATAYPAVIFMPEQMIFHTDIQADRQQDVINELAGHELAHLWWGNSQIDPDDREGAVMLTETLAMYTEMMLYKKMYGTKKMQERLDVHRQIYAAESGFSDPQPLYKVTSDQTHIAYSKGAMTMVTLSRLIGEDKVNQALSVFLARHRYPAPKPISTDLVQALLEVSDPRYHSEIRRLFMEP